MASNIQYVGEASGSNTATLPSFQAGDLAIVFAFRDGSATAPSLPAGWTNIANPAGANTAAHRIGYRKLVAGDTTVGTWTNATDTSVVVLRGANAMTATMSSVATNSTTANGSSTQLNYAALVTFKDGSGDSWVLGMGADKSSTLNTIGATGMTTRASSRAVMQQHTKEGVSTFSSTNYSSTVTTNVWRTISIEIVSSKTGFGQAQADIEATSNSYGQAQADILVTTNKFGQAKAYIRLPAGFSQAQADILQTYPSANSGLAITKFYLHDAVSTDLGTLPTVQQSSYVIQGTEATANINRSMDFQIGTLQTHTNTMSLVADGTQFYARRFISPALAAQTITGTVRFFLAAQQTSASDYPFLCVYLAVWRPSTGTKVSDLVNAQQGTVIFGTSTSEVAIFTSTISMSNLDIQNGDILIFELYAQCAAGNSENVTIYYDGTVEGSNSDNASYVLFSSPIIALYSPVGQAQADIKATSNAFAQAQADIRVLNNEGFGQSQTDIKAVGRGFGQAQADIKATSNVYGQANADIKAISTDYSNPFGQAQADIKAISQVFAQSQADIKAVSRGYGQSQADINATSNAFAQAQADINATSNAFGQAQSDIKVVTQVYGQSQADVKATYNGFAQAQADINATSNQGAQANADIKATSNTFGQAQSDIKTTYNGYAQAQTDIKVITQAYGQAQADIDAISFGFGQAQSDIKAISNSYGQAQSDIKQIYFGFGQTQGDIKAVSNGFGQAQSDIKSTSNSFGQAQTDIKAIGNGFGQAQSEIKQVTNAYGQTQADIKHTYTGFGQVQSWVKSVGYGFAQAQACIRGNAFGQAQADIKHTYNGFGQAQAKIIAIVSVAGYGFGQAGAWIKGNTVYFYDSFTRTTSTPPFDMGTADTGQIWRWTDLNSGSTEADSQLYVDGLTLIVPTNAGDSAYAPPSIDRGYVSIDFWVPDTNAFGMSFTYNDIGWFVNVLDFGAPTLEVSGWDDAGFWALDRNAWATLKIKIIDQVVYAHAWTRSTPEPDTWTTIQTSWPVNNLPEAYRSQAAIVTFGTSQTEQGQYDNILVGSEWLYNQGFGQVQSGIKQIGQGYGQAQACIRGNAYGQAQATIKATSNGFGQANSHISVKFNKFGQANSLIRTKVVVFGQSQAFISATINTWSFGQAQATIKSTTNVFGQAQAFVKLNAGFGQAQAYIFAKNLRELDLSDQGSLTLLISDREERLEFEDITFELQLTDRVSIDLTISDREIVIEPVDNKITLTLIDIGLILILTDQNTSLLLSDVSEILEVTSLPLSLVVTDLGPSLILTDKDYVG